MMGKIQRQQLDEQARLIKDLQIPHKGWIIAVRESLQMPVKFLAKILSVSTKSIYQLQSKEVAGEITIKKLNEVAQAMGCKMVYAIVPVTSLQNLVEKRAAALAKKKVSYTSHSMKLENQQSTIETQKLMEQAIKEQLLQDPKSLWEDNHDV